MLFEIPVLCRIFSTTLLRYFNKNLLLLMPPKYVSALTGKITYDVDPKQNILYRYPIIKTTRMSILTMTSVGRLWAVSINVSYIILKKLYIHFYSISANCKLTKLFRKLLISILLRSP